MISVVAVVIFFTVFAFTPGASGLPFRTVARAPAVIVGDVIDLNKMVRWPMGFSRHEK